MHSHMIFAAFLVLFEPFAALPTPEYGRRFPLGQNDDCGFNRDCRFPNKHLSEGLDSNGEFGMSKRLERFRIASRDDAYGKRRGAALDSLVAGGMFGKAKRNDYDYAIKDEDIDKFQRNIRPLLNTMDLGGSFGRAIKRQVLDTLGSNAFGVQKRKINGISD
ncbi:hypothetical protein RN001_013751 [Aquatica leii]|uniref:Uncharacterized protein n=1 Tax=Aquatica leii TaxID=1421715 RepID=A0AAN7P2Y4_9COLE|nr:hypothetical protein RN001_013751 [Aquatica leii]